MGGRNIGVAIEESILKKRKIDVLIISSAYPPEGGGVATHVYYLVHALRQLTRRGTSRKICNIHLLTTGGPSGEEGIPPNVMIHRQPGQKGHFSVFTEDAHATGVPFEGPVGYCLKNWAIIKPDLIHVHDFEAMMIGSMLKGTFKVPLIMTVHRAPREWDKALPRRNLKDCFLQGVLSFNFADAIVAPSNAYKQWLLAQGFPSEKIKIIPHGVPARWLASRHTADGILQRFNLEDNQRLVLCPTRLDPLKDIETFIEAAALLKPDQIAKNVIFAIAGAGSNDYRSKLEEQARRASVDICFRFGPADHKDVEHAEMPTLYRRATVCVIPSKREGFGQALLEAFVFRRPVVAAITGGIPEVVESEATGLLFERENPNDLAYQMRRIFAEEGLANSLTAKVYDSLLREFTAEIMAERYFRLYKDVTNASIK
jgi:glycosyltransferase involved in cell wall biosynthesis